MTRRMLLSVCLLSLMTHHLEGGNNVDMTLTSFQTGPEIVDSVIAVIEASRLFPDDKLFLKRLAYVESKFGEVDGTFNSIKTGIWQISSAQLKNTQDELQKHEFLHILNGIEVSFSIEWLLITFEDLNKPLVNGLAARILIHINEQQNIPESLTDQADFWSKHFTNGTSPSYFIRQFDNFSKKCDIYVDIIFLIDGSSQNIQFSKNLKLIHSITSELNYESRPVATSKYALLQFSDDVTEVIKLGEFSRPLSCPLDYVRFQNGGLQNMHTALEHILEQNLFNDDHLNLLKPKIVIVFSSGVFNRVNETKEAVMKLKKEGITMILVTNGIVINGSGMFGNHLVWSEDLKEPDILSYIFDRICKAPVMIHASTTNSTISLLHGERVNCLLEFSDHSHTIEIAAGEKSRITFHASQTSAFPSSVYHSYGMTVDENQMRSNLVWRPMDRMAVPCSILFERYPGGEYSSRITISNLIGNQNECNKRPSPCLNDAACQTVPSGFYMCHCKLPYSGKHCQTKKEWCLNETNPCVNGGECVRTAQNYSCLCPENTYGLNCEMERQCERLQPCQNGGMCRDSASGYVCKCAGSYAGENCQYIDYCLSNPCLNAGVCLSLDDDFFCQCPKPFRGKNCQIKDYCSEMRPCLNDGECRNDDDVIYQCACPFGYTGKNCESADHCATRPCKNDGECQSFEETFYCTCEPPFYGRRCQFRVKNIPSSYSYKKFVVVD